jgi:PTS system ascorbate-specific IIC component
MLDALNIGWSYFAGNILTQPAYFIGLIVLVGYILLRRPWYDALAGFIKATVGYMILAVGSGGLVNNFRPILVGLNDRFHLDAMVIDPYFGQNAVTAGLQPVFGRTFAQVMMLLLIAFIFNILLVKFKKATKMRSIFTTGHVQMQQASTAFWMMLFCFPALGNTQLLLMMGLLLGLYWAVGTNLLVKPTQELTDGANFSVAHQQMFAIAIVDRILESMKGKGKKESKRLEDIKLPGFLSIFNENMVSTAVLMTLFFSIILLALGRDYLVEQKFLAANGSFLFYIITTSFNFAVYLAILQLGVRTFVTELTQSFQGISQAWLPGAVPGVDCAVTYGFGSPNAVTIGFLFGALGQFLSIGLLLIFKSPVVIIAGFVPMFFDNATVGVFANNKGGIRAAIIFPFICGICQVFGSALIASWVGLSAYGGYLGMWDWAVLWPAFTVVMKYAGYIGFALCCIFLILIPQLQYRKDKELYFLVTEDYDAYKAKKAG